MRKLVIVILLSLSSAMVQAKCNFSRTNFSSTAATEFLFTLILSKGGVATLIHEYWKPGKADIPVVDEYEGAWMCEGDVVNLKFPSFTEHGRYQKIGENPLGFPVDSKVLVIAPSQGLLSNSIMTEFEI